MNFIVNKTLRNLVQIQLIAKSSFLYTKICLRLKHLIFWEAKQFTDKIIHQNGSWRQFSNRIDDSLPTHLLNGFEVTCMARNYKLFL